MSIRAPHLATARPSGRRDGLGCPGGLFTLDIRVTLLLKPHIYMQKHKERTNKVTKKRIRPFLAKAWRVTLWMFGLLTIYILIGSIDGPMPKDDDLYLPPPPNIPDEQNVKVALLEIFGSADEADNRNEDKDSPLVPSNLVSKVSRQSPYFGPDSQILTGYASDVYEHTYEHTPFSLEDDEGNVIMAASNRVEFMALVDAAIATNECIAAALARAVKRPRYVAKPSAPFDTLDWHSLYGYTCLFCGQARHMRFIETKRYDEAIKDAHILLELADKLLQGYCETIGALYAINMNERAIERLLEIASREEVDENILAEIDDLLVKYDLKDWKALARKMIREYYSGGKSFFQYYSSLPLADKRKILKDKSAARHSVFPLSTGFPLPSFCFHPNRTLALLARDSRKNLALLDDRDSLFTKHETKHKRGPIEEFARVLWPNAVGEFCSQLPWELCLKRIAEHSRRHRASRLMIACRRHFLTTNKLPETVASLSPDILPEPILDPVFNTPYEVKSWREGGIVHVAAFTKGGPEESDTQNNDQTGSPEDGSMAHMSWPTKEHVAQNARSIGGTIHHYQRDEYDYYTSTIDGVEWAYEIHNGTVCLGHEERWGNGCAQYYRAIAATTSGDVVVPTEIGGCKVKEINSLAFAGCSNITSIVIPHSVDWIGCDAFAQCTKLKHITCQSFPECGDDVFDGCESLKSIRVPTGNGISSANRKTVGIEIDIIEQAYAACPSLADADGFAIWKGRLMRYRGNAHEITVPDKVVSISPSAFSACTNLTSVILPGSVKSIGKAFGGCTDLKRIEFRGEEVPNDLARMFDKRTAEQISHTCVIRARKGSKGWDWKARIFGRWNGFKIDFID